jgi:hypothetical protein
MYVVSIVSGSGQGRDGGCSELAAGDGDSLHLQDYEDAPPAKAVVAAIERIQPAMDSLHVQDYKDVAPAKGVATVGSLQPGVENLQAQDYKDATIYYGVYPDYAYGGNGFERSVLELSYQQIIRIPCFFMTVCSPWWLGEYSTYLSHDGAQTPTAVSDSSQFDILFWGPTVTISLFSFVATFRGCI